MLRMLRSLRWTTEKWPSRGPGDSCRTSKVFPSLDREAANSLALWKSVLQRKLDEVTDGMENWLSVALGASNMLCASFNVVADYA
jgi:hypothetical protein